MNITITKDEFGTFSYAFEFEGVAHACFDFPSESEAITGANAHLYMLQKRLPHEVADGLGAIYRP